MTLLFILRKQAKTYNLYYNRRVSGYLVPMNGYHIFIYFCEDCYSISTLKIEPSACTESPSTEWFLEVLKELDPTSRKLFVKEPIELILELLRKLFRYESWYSGYGFC
jgi:hypothetical protein